MERVRLEHGEWMVECVPSDGARLSVLRFRGLDLLTAPPARFRAPRRDHGLYETRPVHGYDDCFPSVDPCRFPNSDYDIPDHGELCWVPWRVRAGRRCLDCSARSPDAPVRFRRVMRFGPGRLDWEFTIENRGAAPYPCLHVMHALMPLKSVAAIELPRFARAFDEARRRAIEVGPGPKGPEQIARMLFGSESGTARMLLLRGVEAGRFAVSFRGGLSILVRFPVRLFPTLGIWWNRGGHPREKGLGRDEFAIEPIPGPASSLAESAAAGTCLRVPARGALCWRIVWVLSGPGGGQAPSVRTLFT